MRNKIIAWLLLLCSLTGKAQQKESIFLCTDRDIYSSGETMLLKVILPKDEPSGITHLDLLNLSGNKIQGVNLKVHNHQADGILELRDSLGSGTYLVRASTRASATHSIKEIFIANRFTDPPLSNKRLKSAVATSVVTGARTSIEINGIEKSYPTRSACRCSMKLSGDLMNQITGDLLVEIVDSTLLYNSPAISSQATLNTTHPVEKEGTILEGLVTDLMTNQPFNHAIVYLSIRDTVPHFNYYLTGTDGRFYFELKNVKGKVPLVIQCQDKKSNRSLKITLIDPERVKNELPPREDQLIPSCFQKSVQKNREAATYQKIFGQGKPTLQQITEIHTETDPFYGNPTYTIYPGLFVDLTDFSEICRELLPGVKFRTYNRNPSMQLFNPLTQSYFQETPLVLMDGIPIRDLNLVKNLGTRQIERIEVCQSERFFGSVILPGVVAIWRTKSDSSDIPLEDDLIEMNFEAIQDSYMFKVSQGKPAHEPDFRQVLLWNPCLQPAPSINIDFLTSDIRGTFRLIIRGKFKDGSVFCEERLFEVN